MIAIDWGTSNFRAYLLDGRGEVLERRSSHQGLLHVEAGAFAAVLRGEIADWLAMGERDILMCGMVGSRNGWRETPYVSCPAGISEIASQVLEVAFDDLRAWIIPGVETETEAGAPELMRGEETAVIGCLTELGGAGLVCLPGTHSKWVTVAERRIQSFLTCMTGEVFSVLRRHTILSQFIESDEIADMETFSRGVACAGEPGGLLHQLFRVRTLTLKGRTPAESSAAFLSGLLIGSEVHSMLSPGSDAMLVGAAPLCRLYAHAITQVGGCARMGDPEAVVKGMFLLGKDLFGRSGAGSAL